jgi:hypothetical protein
LGGFFAEIRPTGCYRFRFQSIQWVCILKQGKRVLSGFQTFLSGKRRAKPGALPVVTVVCLVLLTLLAVVQVAHVHPVDTDSDHCPLCVVMHSAAPVAVTAAVIVLVAVQSSAPVFETHTVTRYWQPQLFTRPPPDGFQG